MGTIMKDAFRRAIRRRLVESRGEIRCKVRPVKMVRIHLGVERTPGGLTILTEEFAVKRGV